jgi:putative phosphoribosyl transferase
MNRTNRIVFRDRTDAGQHLGKHLLYSYKKEDPIVLGVARGGIQVAYPVALALGTHLEMVIINKLPLPGREEVAFGAITEDLNVYVSPKLSQKLEPQQICEIIDRQTDDLSRRVALYRNGSVLPEMKGRTVIIVDDGIATGVTMVPVLQMCRKRGAQQVIIAVPVCAGDYDPQLDHADGIEVLVKPEWFYAVAQSYATFSHLSDDEMMAIITKQKERSADCQAKLI